jgi:hypothetical protein
LYRRERVLKVDRRAVPSGDTAIGEKVEDYIKLDKRL